MCLFITAVVPRSADTDAFGMLVKKHALSFTPCDNPHVQAQLRPTETYVSATAAYCDCGSPLFSGAKLVSPESLARQVSKLRKKKWSQAKIDKWLEATAPRPNDPHASPHGHRGVQAWASFLHEALHLPKVPYVAIVGHWYADGVSSEVFELGPRVSHTVDALREGALGVLDQDVIHEFRLGPLSTPGRPRAP